MNTTTCPECNQEIQFGDHPFCPHGSTLFRDAGQFSPIVVDRKKMEDGQYVYSYPSNSADPVDAGFERVSLNSLREADQFVSERNREEQEIRRETIRGEEYYWADRARERREQAKVELQRRLGKSYSKVGDMVQRMIDARRAKKFQALQSRKVDFHNQALSFDSAHQKEYRDDSKKKISVVVNGFKQ